MRYAFVEIEAHEAVRVLRMKRPPVNSVDVALLEELARCFEEFERDDAVGAVVFTGSGPCFSAGLDLKQLAHSDPEQLRHLVLTLNRVVLTLFACERPVVGAVNGHAIAGGLILALCCDYRIAARTGCSIGLTEVRVGVAYPASALEVARSELDTSALRHLAQIGRNIDAEEALRRGIVNELCDAGDVETRARAMARDLASIPRAAYTATKQQLRASAIERIRRWVDADDDPAMPMWMDPDVPRTAAALLEAAKRKRG